MSSSRPRKAVGMARRRRIIAIYTIETAPELKEAKFNENHLKLR